MATNRYATVYGTLNKYGLTKKYALALAMQLREGEVVTSFTQLTDSELHQIDTLLRGSGESLQRIRRAILAQCHQLGWYRYDDSGNMLLSTSGSKLLDYRRIDSYCLTHTPCRKALNDQRTEELQGTLNQFKAMLRVHLNSKK